MESPDELLKIMETTLGDSDKVYDIGKCKDSIKNINGTIAIVGTYNGSIQTIIGVPDDIPSSSYQEVEFRGFIPVLGEEEVVHEGVIFFKVGVGGGCCYLPFFPKYYGELKPMTKIQVALEVIPFEIKIEKKRLFKKARNIGCYNIDGVSRPYIEEIVGNITTIDENYILLNCGFDYFLVNKKGLKFKENDLISIKGPIFGYFKE